jgi:thiol-disulfide isomerase/thioredoxin
MPMHRRHLLAASMGLYAAGRSWAQGRPSYELTPWPRELATPALVATDLMGRRWDLKALHGRAVVLNFWATWCPPCREEMPSLQQLSEFYDPQQLTVLTVNVEEGPIRIGRYLKSAGLQLNVLLDPKGEASRAWGANALPTSYLIDARGQPRHRLRGPIDWTGEEARRLVEPLLPARSQLQRT